MVHDPACGRAQLQFDDPESRPAVDSEQIEPAVAFCFGLAADDNQIAENGGL